MNIFNINNYHFSYAFPHNTNVRIGGGSNFINKNYKNNKRVLKKLV